ncbi:MAG: VanZ family protein [Microgenomates group bacterium]
MRKVFLWFLTLLWAGLTLYLTTIPNFSPSPDSTLSWILSNGGHFFFFGTLAILFKLDKITNINSVLLTSIYGIVIEYIQLNVPGRSFNFADWLLDTLGAIIFIGIITKYENSHHGRRRLYWGDHS